MQTKHVNVMGDMEPTGVYNGETSQAKSIRICVRFLIPPNLGGRLFDTEVIS